MQKEIIVNLEVIRENFFFKNQGNIHFFSNKKRESMPTAMAYILRKSKVILDVRATKIRKKSKMSGGSKQTLCKMAFIMYCDFDLFFKVLVLFGRKWM
jgi:hypothetical protein